MTKTKSFIIFKTPRLCASFAINRNFFFWSRIKMVLIAYKNMCTNSVFTTSRVRISEA